MVGTIKNVLVNKGYGFIKNEDKEYFFHKDDCGQEWFTLADRFVQEGPDFITVEFDIVKSPKGPRAANVKQA